MDFWDKFTKLGMDSCWTLKNQKTDSIIVEPLT